MRAPDLSPLFAPALPRISPPLRRWATCLALLTPPLGLAQTALNAADPQAPTSPLTHIALPSPTPEAPAPSWRQAHDAVAEFPRGHADILAWEARAATPPGAHAQHQQPPAPAAAAGKAAHAHKPMHDAHHAHHPHGGKP